METFAFVGWLVCWFYDILTLVQLFNAEVSISARYYMVSSE